MQIMKVVEVDLSDLNLKEPFQKEENRKHT
jgi:hypothetical protein